MSRPACSILIVNYNGREALRNCLASIFTFEREIPIEVIVSDNGSSDGSVEMLRNEFPSVNVRENRANLGFAGGNNAAVGLASSEYILMLNPDMEFIEPGLGKLLRLMDEDRDTGICGCMVLNADRTFMKQCRRGYPDPLTALYYVSGLASLFPSHRRIGKYFYSWASVDAPLEVDAVSGSFMLVRAEALKKTGKLGDEYFMYVEDVDLCARMRRSGFRVMYYPAMKIVHHGGISVNQRPERNIFYTYHMTRSHIVLYAKSRKEAGGGVGWHAAFLLICLRYLFLSLVYRNNRVWKHLREFFDIHSGAIGPARYET